jgi:glycosyltransferase 2 family protein
LPIEKDVGVRRHVSLIARVAVAVLAILWVFRDQNWGDLAGVFQRLNPWVFLLALAMFAASQVILSVRWWLLLRAQAIRISVLTTVRLFFLGLFYNNVMPGAVGGDLLKAWYVAKHTDKRLEGVLSVVVDRVVGLLGLVLMAVVTCMLLVPGGVVSLEKAMEAGTPAWLTRYRGTILVVGLVVPAALVFAAARPYGRAVLKKLVGRAWDRSVEPVRRIVRAIVLYCAKPLTLSLAMMLTVLAQAAIIVAFWLLGRNLGMEAGLKYYFVVFPVMWVVAALPISIAGLGVMEGGIRWLFEFLTGAVAAEAVVLALCQRFIWVLASLPGGLIHLLGGHLPREMDVNIQEGRSYDDERCEPAVGAGTPAPGRTGAETPTGQDCAEPGRGNLQHHDFDELRVE